MYFIACNRKNSFTNFITSTYLYSKCLEQQKILLDNQEDFKASLAAMGKELSELTARPKRRSSGEKIDGFPMKTLESFNALESDKTTNKRDEIVSQEQLH